MITQAQLRELIEYDPQTGIFTWKVRRGKQVAGSRAGVLRSDGYIRICIDHRNYFAHRLAWLYMTGDWPSDQIDHLNGVRNDNCYGNLREADNRFNQENLRKSQRRNKTGLLGVVGRYGKFLAQIQYMGRKKYLGWFDTPETAHAAYIEAKRRLHQGCTL